CPVPRINEPQSVPMRCARPHLIELRRNGRAMMMSQEAAIKSDDQNGDHSGVLAADGLSVGERPKGANRRKFLGQVGAAATFAAGALASPSVSRAEAIGGSSNSPGALGPLADVNNHRVRQAFEIRMAEAVKDASLPAATNTTNRDEARY